MKDKILFWLDGHLLYFCLAYSLHKKYDANYYAIIDVPDRLKKFFSEQEFVEFEKIWFYHDQIITKKDPDLQYLENFEKKYNINLWQLAINERLFYKYNEYHQFTKNEILSILEHECRLFEQVLDDAKPNFIIAQDAGLHHSHLLCELARARGIKVLMINISKFGERCYISQNIHTLDFLHSLDDVKGRGLNFVELEQHLKSVILSKSLMKFTNQSRSSKIDKIKAAIQLLFISKNTNVETHYSYYGRTKIRVLIKEISSVAKTKYRESFIRRHSIYKIEDRNFVYLPLHQEPERSLLIDAPFHTNQIETIRHAAKSIPIGYVLYVKEHPTQGKSRGWRPISTYKEILEIPNVKFIHHSISSEELIKKSSLVISVGGSAALEAAFFQKPSILFANLGYSILPSIYKLNCLEDLPNAIRLSINKKVSSTDLDKYVTVLEENSFDFDWMDFILRSYGEFFYGGNLVDVNIEQSQMQHFLEQERDILDKLANEHIKKIKQHKEYQSKYSEENP